MAKTAVPARRNGSADARVIDVDAARAARLEKLGPPPVVRVGGRDFELPAELPSAVVESLGRMNVGDLSGIGVALAGLFGDEADAVSALLPAWADHEYLFEAIMGAYGVTAPES
jgi:hypothetical protein